MSDPVEIVKKWLEWRFGETLENHEPKAMIAALEAKGLRIVWPEPTENQARSINDLLGRRPDDPMGAALFKKMAKFAPTWGKP